MMSRRPEVWARVSLILRPTGKIDVARDRNPFNLMTLVRDTYWTKVFSGPEEEDLNDQLETAEGFMGEIEDPSLLKTEAWSVELWVGWSPKVGQNGWVMQSSLIELLASMNACVVMDIYIDEPGEESIDVPESGPSEAAHLPG